MTGLLLLGLGVPMSQAADDSPARIGIIIDDLGDHLGRGQRAIDLPGPVTFGVLPQTPHSETLARLAHARSKEVILHLPMESTRGKRLGPGGLTDDMDRDTFLRVLRTNLKSVPFLRGVNNHMGSLLTQHPEKMRWLMQIIARRHMYFVDSRTSTETVAGRTARQNNVPSIDRDVFLDNYRDVGRISAQFRQLIATAKRRGTAIAIGHPYPETFAVLSEMIPQLTDQGVELLPVSELVKHQRSHQKWQVSLSPSPKVAKN